MPGPILRPHTNPLQDQEATLADGVETVFQQIRDTTLPTMTSEEFALLQPKFGEISKDYENGLTPEQMNTKANGDQLYATAYIVFMALESGNLLKPGTLFDPDAIANNSNEVVITGESIDKFIDYKKNGTMGSPLTPVQLEALKANGVLTDLPGNSDGTRSDATWQELRKRFETKGKQVMFWDRDEDSATTNDFLYFQMPSTNAVAGTAVVSDPAALSQLLTELNITPFTGNLEDYTVRTLVFYDDGTPMIADYLELIAGQVPMSTHVPTTTAEITELRNVIERGGKTRGEELAYTRSDIYYLESNGVKIPIIAVANPGVLEEGRAWFVDKVVPHIPVLAGVSLVFGVVVNRLHHRYNKSPGVMRDEAAKQAEIARLKEEFQKLGKEKFMSRYADDLIEVAAQLHEKSKTSGEKIQLLGRSVEIKEAFSVWLMKTKSMSVFLAPAGAGKTVSAIEMALHIYFRRLIMQREVELRTKGELGANERLTRAMFEASNPKTLGLEWSLCPEVLAREEYWNFGMTKMVAGTNLRGDLEGRVTFILDLLRKFQNMRLHIDELADLTEDHGQNESQEARVMKALKPGLADGTVKGTASAVFKRWRAIAAKSDEIGRRFRPIMLRLLPNDVVDNIGGRSISNQLIYWKDRGRWVPPSDDTVSHSILGKKSAKPLMGGDKISRNVLPPTDKVPPSVLVQGVTLVANDGAGNLVPLINADGEYVIPGINDVLRTKSAKSPGANPDRTKSLGEDVTSLILYDVSQGDIDPARITVNADGSCTVTVDAPFITNLIDTRITDPVVQGVLYRLDETVSDLSRFSVSAEMLGVDLTAFEPLPGESPDHHTTRILNLQAELEMVAKLYADLEAGIPISPDRIQKAIADVKVLFARKGLPTVVTATAPPAPKRTGTFHIKRTASSATSPVVGTSGRPVVVPGAGKGGGGGPKASIAIIDGGAAMDLLGNPMAQVYLQGMPEPETLFVADPIPLEEQPAANNTLHFEEESKTTPKASVRQTSNPHPSFWKGFGMEAGINGLTGVIMEGAWMGLETIAEKVTGKENLHVPSIVRTPIDIGGIGVMAVWTAAKGTAGSTAAEFSKTLLPGMARFLPGAIVGGGITSWGLNQMGYETDGWVNRLGSVIGAGVAGAGSNTLLASVGQKIASVPFLGPVASKAVGGIVAPVMGAVMAYPMVGEVMDFAADQAGVSGDYTGRTTIQVTTSGALGYLGNKALGVVAEKVGLTSAIEMAKQAGVRVASQATTYVIETAIPAVTSYVSAAASATGVAIVEGGAAGSAALTGVVLAASGLVASTWEVNTMSDNDYQAQRKEGGMMADILDSDMSWLEYVNYQNLPKLFGGEKITTNPLDRHTWKSDGQTDEVKPQKTTPVPKSNETHAEEMRRMADVINALAGTSRPIQVF